MSFFDRLIVVKTKFISVFSQFFRLGAGETWPGEIALMIQPSITSALVKQLRKGVILIAGTNGKTTTSLMLTTVLEYKREKVVHNATGANLLNGIVSSFIRSSDWTGNINADWGVFEVDENSLPIVLQYVTPKTILLLNLFRDQLDRYGEVDVIVEKWEKALKKLPKSTTFVINSDDPGVSYLGKKANGKVVYFGVNDKKYFLKDVEHATDSTFCMNCGGRLTYAGIYYSHIGLWHCERCSNKRPIPTVSSFPSPLPGLYNQYNTLAAVAAANSLGISKTYIQKSLSEFHPAFGRQEEFAFGGKRIKLFLSKNPAGFNASLRTVIEMGARNFLIVLNDRIPDGRDVSWIWDVDFEMLGDNANITLGGDRVYDLALRLKYALGSENFVVESKLNNAVRRVMTETPKGQTLYVLATYSAMLEVRKILSGRKIL